MSQTNPPRAREFATLTDPTTPRAKRIPSTRRWLDQWMVLLRTIGNIQAWVLLTIFYVVIITPFGLCFRLFTDKRKRKSHWQPFAHSYEHMEFAREQS